MITCKATALAVDVCWLLVLHVLLHAFNRLTLQMLSQADGHVMGELVLQALVLRLAWQPIFPLRSRGEGQGWWTLVGRCSAAYENKELVLRVCRPCMDIHCLPDATSVLTCGGMLMELCNTAACSDAC